MNQKQVIYVSLEAGLVGLLSFIIGYHLSIIINDQKGFIDGLWCMISALVVLQSLVNESLITAKSRILGTLVGSIIAGLVCFILGYGYISILLSITLCVYILNAFKYESGIRIATATAAVISGLGVIHPEYSPEINALMRSIDTLIGVFISILAVYISYKLKIRKV